MAGQKQAGCGEHISLWQTVCPARVTTALLGSGHVELQAPDERLPRTARSKRAAPATVIS